MTKQLMLEEITRDEINSAMEKFLQKGGKIKKIEQAVPFVDDFFEESLTMEDSSLLNISFTTKSSS